MFIGISKSRNAIGNKKLFSNLALNFFLTLPKEFRQPIKNKIAARIKCIRGTGDPKELEDSPDSSPKIKITNPDIKK